MVLRVRKKRRRQQRSVVWQYWWVAPVLAGATMIFWVATGPRWSHARIDLPSVSPTGYTASTPEVLQEYLRFYGKPLNNPEIERLCNQANERVAAKDYSSAVGLLEQVVKVAAVPAVFNNLGVLYAGLNDRSRAIGAFRDALARDINYRPVRANLYRMKDLMALGADPVTREVESNDTQALANVVAPGKPVDGEIAAGVNDLDYFRVTTPPAPRDLIVIEVVNRSTALAPVLKIFDAEGRLTDMGSLQREPGASVKLTISPPPNSTLFLELSGYGNSAGGYTLSVQPQKAFDAYEPNDEIYNSRPLNLGVPVEANIMDPADTDFFSFVSPRTGTVNIVIDNRSITLIPALGTFSPEMRSSGFGPDIRKHGESLRHTMEVVENRTYYLQVWPQANTSGAYTLKVE